MCSLCISERTVNFAVYIFNWLVFITEVPSVYCAVRNESLHKTHTSRPYLLTHSTVQSPSWEANRFAASQEIPRTSRNPKVHYRTHKRPPPVSILGPPNPVHIYIYIYIYILCFVYGEEIILKLFWVNFEPQKGFDPRTAQPVASRYTDWAIAAHTQ